MKNSNYVIDCCHIVDENNWEYILKTTEEFFDMKYFSDPSSWNYTQYPYLKKSDGMNTLTGTRVPTGLEQLNWYDMVSMIYEPSKKKDRIEINLSRLTLDTAITYE